MKRLAVLFAVTASFAVGVARADAPAVANDPSGAFEKTKSVVDVLAPGYDVLYDLRSGEWFQGASASLWNVESRSYHLASVRLGYYADAKIAGGVQLDLPGLTRRYVPERVQGIATAGYLDALWKLAGKYGAVGLVGGYDFDRDRRHILVGLTLGGRVKF